MESSSISAVKHEASLFERIEALRASVRGHKQHALKVWNASVPHTSEEQSRAVVGKFTQQFVHSE